VWSDIYNAVSGDIVNSTVVVSGLSDTSLNGRYVYDGEVDGKPSYRLNNNTSIFWISTPAIGTWRLETSTGDASSESDVAYPWLATDWFNEGIDPTGIILTAETPNHIDWSEKQALGHIAAAYRGDTGTPENLATYIDWPWRYQVASIVIHPRIDADALAYIQRVETADGATLESGVRLAIDNFVRGCKTDGIWDAIKSSAILAGARTLSGALQPLVGVAPTNFNFVSGDYNRKTGLVGDGSTKYLDSNRNNNADPQNSKHMASYLTSVTTSGGYRIVMGSGQDFSGDSLLGYRWDNVDKTALMLNTGSGFANELIALNSGLFGHSRSNSSQLNARRNGNNSILTQASAAPLSKAVQVFRATSLGIYASHRLAFYSIGESLDLALLDARVTNLTNAYAAEIP
jgi:hypothetical protein